MPSSAQTLTPSASVVSNMRDPDFDDARECGSSCRRNGVELPGVESALVLCQRICYLKGAEVQIVVCRLAASGFRWGLRFSFRCVENQPAATDAKTCCFGFFTHIARNLGGFRLRVAFAKAGIAGEHL
jgi:hypothetical protein